MCAFCYLFFIKGVFSLAKGVQKAYSRKRKEAQMTKSEFEEKFSKLSIEQQRIIGSLVCDMVAEGEGNKDWISVKTASEMLGLSKMTIRRKIEEGVIRSKNLGKRKTLVALADIDALRRAQLGL